jgi:hypothetical protein
MKVGEKGSSPHRVAETIYKAATDNKKRLLTLSIRKI